MRQIAAFCHRRILCAGAVCLVLSTTLASVLAAAEQAASLKILVLAGEDGVNIIDKKTAVAPVVEVRDQNDLPVAGASVTFVINGRNSATFANGLRQLILATDSAGRVTVSGLNPVARGTFQIQVRATFQSQIATATIHQTNFATAAAAAQGAAAGGSGAGAAGGAAAGGGGLSAAAIGGIVAAAGGAAATAAVVKNRGDSTPQAPVVSYAGTWNGQTGQGKPITFTVTGDRVTQATFRGAVVGANCTNPDFMFGVPTSAPISNGAFSFAAGAGITMGFGILHVTFTMTGRFDTSTSASGTLQMTIPVAIDPGECLGTAQTTWSAQKSS